MDLNHTLHEIDLKDIHRTFDLTAAEYTFFSSTYGTFSRIDHMVGHKKVLANLRRLKSNQLSFSTTTV